MRAILNSLKKNLQPRTVASVALLYAGSNYLEDCIYAMSGKAALAPAHDERAFLDSRLQRIYDLVSFLPEAPRCTIRDFVLVLRGRMIVISREHNTRALFEHCDRLARILKDCKLYLYDNLDVIPTDIMHELVEFLEETRVYLTSMMDFAVAP